MSLRSLCSLSVLALGCAEPTQEWQQAPVAAGASAAAAVAPVAQEAVEVEVATPEAPAPPTPSVSASPLLDALSDSSRGLAALAAPADPDWFTPVRVVEPAEPAVSEGRRGRSRADAGPARGPRAPEASSTPDGRATSLSIGGAKVTRGLPQHEIRAVAEASMGQVRACYERQLKSDPSLKGRLVVSWRVERDGSVSRARAQEDGLGSDELQRCILETVAAWSFPKASDHTDVSFPFLLKPGRI